MLNKQCALNNQSLQHVTFVRDYKLCRNGNNTIIKCVIHLQNLNSQELYYATTVIPVLRYLAAFTWESITQLALSVVKMLENTHTRTHTHTHTNILNHIMCSPVF